jgi:hypothetical protein
MTQLERAIRSQPASPIVVRLKLLAMSFSRTRRTDPDKAIAGRWADEAMWAIGRPR